MTPDVTRHGQLAANAALMQEHKQAAEPHHVQALRSKSRFAWIAYSGFACRQSLFYAADEARAIAGSSRLRSSADANVSYQTY